jgi:hypothetical protein
MLVTQTLRLVGLAAGAPLYILLAGLAARRRRWGALAALALAAAWYAAGAAGLFLQAATGRTVEAWMAALRGVGLAGAAAAGFGAVVSLTRERRAGGVPPREPHLSVSPGIAAHRPQLPRRPACHWSVSVRRWESEMER